MKHCVYYQAEVKRADTWFMTAVLRSFEHLAFDRTLDKKTGLFEFFVPQDLEKSFLDLMNYFENENSITNLQKLTNRLEDPGAEL